MVKMLGSIKNVMSSTSYNNTCLRDSEILGNFFKGYSFINYVPINETFYEYYYYKDANCSLQVT